MASSPKVTLKQGCVIGGKSVLPNGNSFNFFKGIPYAEPPVGTLRFKAPVPLESFKSPEIECIQEGNECFQKDKTTGKYTGSEDCLFLNVFTPKIDADGELLPVMVFIHGGGFVSGNGNSDTYNPLYLMQENVVVVTLNYRLGPLGFLSFPEGNIPGNAGIKDQRLALKWVQQNISKFGGDNKNVTLFGHSAGSFCTHLHVLSKESRKYFHKAIMQSGLANMVWLIETKASDKTKELAKTLGCSSNKPIEIIEFLQNHNDIEDFFEPIYRPPKLEDIALGFSVPTKPVIEEESPEAVCTESSLESMRNKIDIPLIIGCTSADGSVLLPGFMRMMEQLEDNLSYFVPDGDRLDTTKDLEIAIKKFYFKDKKIDKTTLNQLNKLLTDFFLITPTQEAVKLHSRIQTNSPLYSYVFDFCGDLNMHKKKHKLENVVEGAGHSDELFYIFQSKYTPEPWNKREKKIVESMCKMWANFAKCNNPSMKESDWRAINKTENSEDFVLEAFEINDTMQMLENPMSERINFWRDLKQTVESLRFKK